MDFEACRFDFRLDAKNGLTPSKRKKSERRGQCYNTLFKCKICGSLYDNRAALLEHKLVHNDHQCPICDVKVARKATLKEHLNVIHGIGKVKEAAATDSEAKIDQTAALREHIQIVRGLAQKARKGQNKAAAQRDQKVLHENQHSISGLQQMPLPVFPPNASEPFPHPESQPQMPPLPMTSMPGYVYINVPVIMSGDQQQDPKQSPAIGNQMQMPFIPNFPGYPGFPQGKPPTDIKTEKSDIQPLPSPLNENDIIKIKPERRENEGGGMALLHFPVAPNMEDLEPGEIRNMNRSISNVAAAAAAAASGYSSNMGMQLPTMVKLEDYQSNQSAPGQLQTVQQPQPAPHYINMGGTGGPNVINIHPQQLTVSDKQYAFDGGDFRKQAFISTSFTPDEDEDNCVVDLSMDNTKSEAALAEHLSLTSNTFSSVPIDYMDASQQPEDCVLDLSNKKSAPVSEALIDGLSVDQHREIMPDMGISSSPRPSSAASSASESSPIKSARKPRSGGLNSMVAKLWQTKIKKKQEDSDVPASDSMETGVSGDGSEQNPITLTEGDEVFAEDPGPQHPVAKLELLRCVELQATGPNTTKTQTSKHKDCNTEPPRKTRRKRAKPDYCCITYHSCKVCKQLFESADAMWDHALQHADFYNERCDYCDFNAPTKDLIQKHCAECHGVPTAKDDSARTRSEGKNKEYPCRVCGKCLRSPAGLQVHMVRHDEAAERQYTCDVKDCQATFANQRDCLSHHTQVHKNTKLSRRYLCPHEDCTKNYAKRDGLKHHLMSHTGERPLACNYNGCKKTFREAKHLKIHRLRHTDEKPMQCKLCDYACRQRTSMNWHMKTRHGLEKSCTSDNRTIYMNSNTVVIESCESGATVNTNGDSTVYMEEEVMYQNGGMAMEELETEDEIESPMPSSTDESCAEDNLETSGTGGGMGDEGVLNLTLPLLTTTKSDGNDNRTTAIINPIQAITSEANFFANILQARLQGFSKEADSKPNFMTGEIKFHTCKICKQLFENSEKMWSHRLVEHDEILKFYCEVCGFTSDIRSEFQSHMGTIHNREVTDIKEYVCLWCGREYSSRHGLKQHLLMKHPGESAPSYPCPYDNCENKVLSKQALKLHIQRRHFKAQQEAAMSAAATAAAAAATVAATTAAASATTPDIQCPIEGCNRAFDTVGALTNHQLTHSEERPLVCDFQGCDKTFREAKHLKVHKMLHTDERPLKCLQCQYSCRQRNSMNWHMKSKHSMQKQVSADGRTIYVPM